ncbi:ribosome hibernation-promoting factor, HPF/YfiA family [Anaerotalea alkaliphila]|uniref:Ribosome hibernation promoting factor n=1 Tax=Anaerotalea alkaliphila TaxID=2662126 RepID=A0A7X5HVX7_9FIRM|nr:ribosome-associated translation inhibitor RaiA [Anaerotalea alkaliphila]NDL67643.1 ribosome-associated translation inhibitor RaiA [Anaerotalea alkaliphila]
MRYIVSGKNIEVTAALRDIAIQKISKLEKYFSDDTDAHITMSVQKQKQIIEVTIPIKGGVIRAEEREDDMYAAIDLVVDILERQLMKHRKKLVDRHHQGGSFKNEFFEIPEDENEGLRIVRTKKFAMKPMDPEEACMEMELLGHDFYVFRNSETDEVNVVYKRKANNYGLIEPEF